jgi:hypothetical protein
VEVGRVENKGTVRVEARLKDDRRAGTWKMFLADGTEVFRGEWEAVRAKAKEGKSSDLGLVFLFSDARSGSATLFADAVRSTMGF